MRSGAAKTSSEGRSHLVAVLGLALFGVACQGKDEHPVFLPTCEATCNPAPGVIVNTGGPGAPSGAGGADAGPTTLTGQVFLLNDSSFVRASLYSSGAAISADGASGAPVTALWDGADPFLLADLLRAGTTWVTVKPNLVGGDALPTIQAVGVGATPNIDLSLISGAALDDVFGGSSLQRLPNFGQVVLFFRSGGTGVPLQGLRVKLAGADFTSYRSGSGWLLDDGLAVTDQSGLVVFGNVAVAANRTQTVVVTRAATATRPAVPGGQFVVRVLPDAATLAAVNVQF